MPGALRIDTILTKAARSGRDDLQLWELTAQLLQLVDEPLADVTGSTLISLERLSIAGIQIHFPPTVQIRQGRPDIEEA
jgi:hypothetical protein